MDKRKWQQAGGHRSRADYLAALVVSAAALAGYLATLDWIGDRNVLILFLVPIIFSAYLGGLGPGMLATFVAASGADYFLLPPVGSFAITNPADLTRWIILLLTGVLVSVLSEALHRARRQAETALGRERAVTEQIHLRGAALEAAANGIVITDHSGTIIWVNPAFTALTGYGPDEVIGRNPRLLKSGRHEQEYYRKMWETILSHRTWHGEVINRRKDGSLYTEDMTITPVIDSEGEITHFIAIKLDVSARKMTEMALRESEERLQTVIENMHEGLIICAPDGQLLHWNRAALEMHGFNNSDEWTLRLSEFQDIFEFSTPDGLTLPFEEWPLSRILRGETIRNFELGVRRQDMDWERVVSYNGGITHEPNGKALAFLTITDITPRKKADAERQKLELQLRQAQKMEAIGQLSGGIAHDFNNILTAIAGNVNLLREDLSPDHPVQEFAAEIDKASNRARDLVRRILSFSRQQGADRKPMDLAPAVEEVVKLLRATLPASVDIRTHFADGMPQVSADATQIHQVMMNLGTNAAQAIGKGTGLLEINMDVVVLDADRPIPSPELYPGRFVRLSIRDTGCGMDAATLERIFEPFFTTKPVGEGTGLGLSVVHGIMKNHQGAITVHSQPGRGTVFHLYFPACETSTIEPTKPPASTPASHGQRILYVDDEDQLVYLVTNMLERLGYQVAGCSNPAKALKIFQSRPGDFDALVSDCAMPGMTGFDLARQVRDIRPDLPIVLSSGYIRPQDTEAANQLGIADIILKPNTIEELGLVLNNIFSGTLPIQPLPVGRARRTKLVCDFLRTGINGN